MMRGERAFEWAGVSVDHQRQRAATCGLRGRTRDQPRGRAAPSADQRAVLAGRHRRHHRPQQGDRVQPRHRPDRAPPGARGRHDRKPDRPAGDDAGARRIPVRGNRPRSEFGLPHRRGPGPVRRTPAVLAPLVHRRVVQPRPGDRLAGRARQAGGRQDGPRGAPGARPDGRRARPGRPGRRGRAGAQPGLARGRPAQVAAQRAQRAGLPAAGGKRCQPGGAGRAALRRPGRHRQPGLPGRWRGHRGRHRLRRPPAARRARLAGEFGHLPIDRRAPVAVAAGTVAWSRWRA